MRPSRRYSSPSHKPMSRPRAASAAPGSGSRYAATSPGSWAARSRRRAVPMWDQRFKYACPLRSRPTRRPQADASTFRRSACAHTHAPAGVRGIPGKARIGARPRGGLRSRRARIDPADREEIIIADLSTHSAAVESAFKGEAAAATAGGSGRRPPPNWTRSSRRRRVDPEPSFRSRCIARRWRGARRRGRTGAGG